MELLEFDDAKFSNEILDELKGKKFFAVSIVDGVYTTHIPVDMMKSQLIYACEFVKYIVMQKSMYKDDENEMDN